MRYYTERFRQLCKGECLQSEMLSSTVRSPLGIILGGYLADYVLEPFMDSENTFAVGLGKIVGTGTGSGMAVMFLCTGICGGLVSTLSYFNREIKKLKLNILLK